MRTFSKYETWGAYHWIWALRYKNHWYNMMLRFNLESLPNAGSILDIGCGDGLACALLKEKGLDVVGFDNNKAAIEMARILIRGVKTELTSIEDIKLDRNYDYFLAQNVIEHFKDPQPLIDLFNKHCDKFMILSTDIPSERLGILDSHYYSLEELTNLFKPHTVEKLYQFRTTYGVKITKQ